MSRFFRALNPFSKSSGISHRTKPMLSILASDEITDLLPHEIIQLQWEENLSWERTLDATYLCLVGEHYGHPSVAAQKTVFEQVMTAFFRPYLIPIMIGSELHALHKHNHQTGIKGVLDYLVFPLLARKLISDTYLDHRKNTPIINAVAWAIAIPLEVIRHSLGLALTIALTPVAAFVHLLRNLINALSGIEIGTDVDKKDRVITIM